MSDRKSNAPGSGPLTEQELDQLGLWHGRGANLRERAVTEIRELRKMVEGYDDLLADNAKLRAEVARLLFDNNTLEKLIRAYDDRPARIESAVNELVGLLKEYKADWS